MNTYKFSVLIVGLLFSCLPINLFSQFYFPDKAEFSVELDTELYADASEVNTDWIINNTSVLEEENRLEDIEEYHTLAVNPFFNAETFCWKESYGRGVGAVPNQCQNGMELQAGLCYQRCASGYYGVGPVCWKYCPGGFRDDGAYCAKPAAYGRGVGYAAWDMWRCEAAYGRGNCEWYGAIIYPKCKSGFYNAGCCICSPNCPPGWGDIGVSCVKPSYGRGVGVPPTGCSGGREYDAGLCYTPCQNSYTGIGPVCWKLGCPNVDGTQWSDCGAGCAQTAGHCATGVIDMVLSPLAAIGKIAGMVVTGGSSGAITLTSAAGNVKTFQKVINVATKVGKVSKLVIEKELIQKAIARKNGQALSNQEKKGLKEYAEMAYDATISYQFDWKDIAFLDPTGLTKVAAAYARPLCSEISSANTGNTGSTTGTSMKAFENRFVFITNYFNYEGKTNNRINTEKGPVRIDAIHDGAWSAHWTLKPVGGNYYLIINRWQNTKIHIGTGESSASNISESDQKGHWRFEPVSGKPGGYKIVNRSASNHSLYWGPGSVLKSLDGNQAYYNVFRVEGL